MEFKKEKDAWMLGDGITNWKFTDGIEVYQEEVNFLPSFKVYDGEKFLGTVYPACQEDAEDCIQALDAGSNPVADSWEDGCGNTCSCDGWGEEEE